MNKPWEGRYQPPECEDLMPLSDKFIDISTLLDHANGFSVDELSHCVVNMPSAFY